MRKFLKKDFKKNCNKALTMSMLKNMLSKCFFVVFIAFSKLFLLKAQ